MINLKCLDIKMDISVYEVAKHEHSLNNQFENCHIYVFFHGNGFYTILKRHWGQCGRAINYWKRYLQR